MTLRKKVIVRINWIPTEQGGKKIFPLIEYSTAAHFLADVDGQFWSVILKVISNHDNYETTCYINFLVSDNAPEHLLYIGSKFELFEAGKVADGEIVRILAE